jgi:acyl-CoA reductase-like NAD-dependent aldehyde dehydrogenase
MGRAVAPKLAQRFARAILELGGNNAAVVTPTADLDLTLRGVAFAAMGTAASAAPPCAAFSFTRTSMTASCRG